MNPSLKEHWNEIYAVLDVGAGASTFIDYLVKQGFKNIIAADISEIALNKIKERLDKEKASYVRWIVDDITNPVHIQDIRDIAVWHDRAVLHFLLEEKQQKVYLSTLKKVLKNKGYVIIAAFSLKEAKKCTGLDVKNHNQNLLAEFLGDDFKLLEYFDHTYYMPSGEPRPYIYTLFQKT
jgi:cyclopropane fatty-acyl-phospholipid synthase-like methyltransferase